jgi:hypothetical protein
MDSHIPASLGADGTTKRSAQSLATPAIRFIVVVIFLSAVFLLLLGGSMTKPLERDENQFVASGKVLADHLLLPYRDYPYFHMPYLVFIYGALFRFTDHLLLAARLLSVVCAWLTIVAVFYMALHAFQERSRGLHFLVAAGSIGLLVFNPVFAHTAGRAWNHEAVVLLALLAFLAHCRGMKTGSVKHICFSGALVGLAVGIRLTFAPAILGFLLVLFIYSRQPKRSLLFFISGLLVALLPSILLFAIAPEQFVFGNLGYSVSLNRAYWQEMGRGTEMTIQSKILYFVQLVSSPDSLPVSLLFAFLLFSRNWLKVFADPDHRIEFPFILILLPFLLVGSFAPGLSFYYEYFYAPLTFTVIGLVYAMASFADKKVWSILSLGLFTLAVVGSAIYGLPVYRNSTTALSLQNWVPLNLHKTGRELAGHIGIGKVLTLFPVYPLEGGAEIYESLVTGSFAWRTGHLLSETEREKFRVMCESNLLQFLRAEKPEGILVVFETALEHELEKPLENYAIENRFKPVQLRNGSILYVSPTRR